MTKRITAFLATMTVAFLSLVAVTSPAQAAPPAAKGCQASDRSDVQVNKKANSVTVRGDTSTGGNNYSCYTNIAVAAGDIVTFDYVGTCGGGAPRVFLQFDGGTSAGENTFDSDPTCSGTAGTGGGTVTYTVMKSGTITGFALIHDRDNGSTTYSDLVIDGIPINF